MPLQTPEHYVSVAEKHLAKVKDAVDNSTDWDDLTTYGLYCLEACVVAAAIIKSLNLQNRTKHWGKGRLAKQLHRNHSLPDIEDLMEDLNEARKANAYGDEEFEEEDFDAEQIAGDIEEYFNKVKAMLP